MGRMKDQALLCFGLALLKCTVIYFTEAKAALCLRANFKHRLWRVCSILQFQSIYLPQARAFTSQKSQSQKLKGSRGCMPQQG